MATGWIKISRDIQTHWIYQDAEKLKWWLDLLLLANYEDKEFNIKFKVFQCKRGQLLYSLKSLSQRWNVSKSVVNNFLEMLRKQNMIETENETVTTRITICNYDTYQQKENANETQIKRNQNANETQGDTTKEYKEEEEIKEKKKPIKKAVALDFYFVANNFSECFMKWIEYKRELKQAYKSQTSLQQCYNNLLKLSAGNPTKAMHVVNQSIGNGWAGLFEFKGQIEPEDKTDKFFANGQWHKKTPLQKYH